MLGKLRYGFVKPLSLALALVMGLALSGFLVMSANWQAGRAALSNNILYVSSDGNCFLKTPCYNHPQLAVDAAAPGDTIKLLGGETYTQVYSNNGHDQIIYIDKDLTLIGGYDYSYSDPPYENFMWVELQPPPGKRAVYIDNYAQVVLRNFYVYSATNQVGGAININQADVTILGSHFSRNTGANCPTLAMSAGKLKIENSTFYFNEAAGQGAAICAYAAAPGSLIRQVLFSGNIAGYCTAMVLSDSQMSVERTQIFENSAISSAAGGIFLSGGTYTFTNNVFLRNYAAQGPTVLDVNYSTVTLLHNTFNGDYYPQELVKLSSSSTLSMQNNILVNADTGIEVQNGSSLTGDHNLFYSVTDPAKGGGTINLTEVYTNDPGFISAVAFAILPDSPAEGKAVDIGLDIDFVGFYRPLGSGPDLGAMEAPEPVQVMDASQDFSALLQDPWGMATTLFIPAGATADGAILSFAPLYEPGQGFTNTYMYAGRAFELSFGGYMDLKHIFLPLVQQSSGSISAVPPASPDPIRERSFIFNQPVQLTLQYPDVIVLDENELKLYYYDEDDKQWKDVAETCSPASTYTRDPVANLVTIDICHLSRFGMGTR